MYDTYDPYYPQEQLPPPLPPHMFQTYFPEEDKGTPWYVTAGLGLGGVGAGAGGAAFLGYRAALQENPNLTFREYAKSLMEYPRERISGAASKLGLDDKLKSFATPLSRRSNPYFEDAITHPRASGGGTRRLLGNLGVGGLAAYFMYNNILNNRGRADVDAALETAGDYVFADKDSIPSRVRDGLGDIRDSTIFRQRSLPERMVGTAYDATTDAVRSGRDFILGTRSLPERIAGSIYGAAESAYDTGRDLFR